MATRTNPRRATRQRDRVQGDDREDPSTPQRGTPSKKRLANIPKQVVENASTSLRITISKDDDDDDEIRHPNPCLDGSPNHSQARSETNKGSSKCGGIS
jgi:hypothetical protein